MTLDMRLLSDQPRFAVRQTERHAPVIQFAVTARCRSRRPAHWLSSCVVIACVFQASCIGRSPDTSQQNGTRQNVEVVAKALVHFQSDGGNVYPSIDLRILLCGPSNGGGPSGPYINDIDSIRDWYGTYLQVIDRNGLRVCSAGPDRCFGTDDDIVSWIIKYK